MAAGQAVLTFGQIIGTATTAILAETREIFGPEQLLLRRPASPEVGAKLIGQICW